MVLPVGEHNKAWGENILMEKGHLEILLEDMNGKFDLVLEGHEGLRDDMWRLEERLCKKIDLNTARIEVLADHIRFGFLPGSWLNSTNAV